MSTRQCADNARDREAGAKCERDFCIMAANLGKLVTPHQLLINGKSASAFRRRPHDRKWKRISLPDVTIWSTPGEHHEIKHKNRTHDGCYGLELYRLEYFVDLATETGQKVYYTIHDWEIAGARDAYEDIPCRMEDWFTADVEVLYRQPTKPGWDYTYIDGVRSREKVEMRYWTASRHFRPLAEPWAVDLAARVPTIGS